MSLSSVRGGVKLARRTIKALLRAFPRMPLVSGPYPKRAHVGTMARGMLKGARHLVAMKFNLSGSKRRLEAKDDNHSLCYRRDRLCGIELDSRASQRSWDRSVCAHSGCRAIRRGAAAIGAAPCRASSRA